MSNWFTVMSLIMFYFSWQQQQQQQQQQQTVVFIEKALINPLYTTFITTQNGRQTK